MIQRGRALTRSWSRATGTHRTRTLEVERKFRVDGGEEGLARAADMLTQRGFVLASQTEFTDEYFDVSPTFALSTRDMWLRRRANQLELKLPIRAVATATATPGNETTDTYDELTHADDIHAALSRVLAPATTPLTTNIFTTFNLTTSFIITTNRSTFTPRSSPTTNSNQRAKVVLDSCRFGPDGRDGEATIGEVELLVSSPADVPAAQLHVESLCASLGFDTSPTPGKVLMCIARTRPDHYRALVRVGLVQRKVPNKTC